MRYALGRLHAEILCEIQDFEVAKLRNIFCSFQKYRGGCTYLPVNNIHKGGGIATLPGVIPPQQYGRLVRKAKISLGRGLYCRASSVISPLPVAAQYVYKYSETSRLYANYLIP